ncbi:MAG: DUF1634 domain-containing protein [Rhodopirellula sp.]|mgnify:CR=1 FL=1|nr:DUF1634 domain-containing protein [Rhodopirellula sp.]
MSGAPQRLRHWVHRTLVAGVVLSGTLLLVGLVLVFLRHQPRPEGPPPGQGKLLVAALAGDGLAMLDLAPLLLVVTPMFRVAVLAIGWTLEGDQRFALVALAVLRLLGVNLLLGVG